MNTDRIAPSRGTPPLYTPAELDRIGLEEFAAHEGRAVADAMMTRNGFNRLHALAWLEYRWSDASLDTPIEQMVRGEATAYLLSTANGIEKDAHAATQLYGVNSYEAALTAITMTLTHQPLVQQVAA